MPKRTRRPEDEGQNAETISAIEGTRRGKKGKRTNDDRRCEVPNGKRLRALPGDSPHRRRKSLSSFETPKAVTPARSPNPASKKHRRSKD